MKKIFTLSAIIALSSIMFTVTSCKKEKKEVDDETQSVVDNAVCEQEFMRIAPEVNNKGAGSPKQAGFKTTAACGDWVCLGVASGTNQNIATDTLDVNRDGHYDNGPVKWEVAYTGTCSIADGAVRTGTMTIITTGKWENLDADSGYVQITFAGYKVNGINYQGTTKITKPAQGVVRTVVTNGLCSNGTWNIEYACDKTITIDEPNGTASIYGTSNGKNREGRTFSVNIPQATPIIKKRTCKWITSGVLELTPSGFKTRTVDFGSGTCDDDATYTVDGQTVSFKMN